MMIRLIQESTLNDFKEFSNKNKIELFILNKPSELEEVITKINPDLCFLIGWYWIIKEKILNMASYGFVGIHGSLLPKYRGWAPLVWPIINGEKESGISLFYLDNGLDSGDIIAQKKFLINVEDTIEDVLSKAERLAEIILIEYGPLLLNGKAPRTKQNDELASYCSKRTPSDGKIDWKDTNINIYNFIRAQTEPYPGAFCYSENNQKIIINKAKLFPYEYYGVPGLVVQINKESAIVTCGKGAIIIEGIRTDTSQDKSIKELFKKNQKLY